jgi:hypothetical protein
MMSLPSSGQSAGENMSPAQPGQDNLANMQANKTSLSPAALNTHQAFELPSLTGDANATTSESVEYVMQQQPLTHSQMQVPVNNPETKLPKAPKGKVHKKKKRGNSYQQRMYEAMKA